MPEFNTDFLQVKSENIVNFIRFRAINALELNLSNLTISLSIQDQKENFIIHCSSGEVFRAYVDILSKVLKLDYSLGEQQS